jgi:hypothetical protein
MSNTSNIQHSSVRHCLSERGATVVVLLYALSIFSVMSVTLLKNAALETRLRTADNPDVHVVLYAGGAGSPKVVGRLNLPTMIRSEDSRPDESVEIEAPGPVGAAMTAELEPGWAYTVQLSATLRVCCDGGDDACGSLTWDQPVPEGSLAPALRRALEITEPRHRLQFELSSSAVPENAGIDPAEAVDAAFLVRATRLAAGSSSGEAPEGASAVACRLVGPDTTFATGTLTLRPGTDEHGQINRISSGTMELNYNQPRQ